MPIYSFRCQKCNTNWETYFSMKDKKEQVCHDCGNMAERVFTIPTMGIDTKTDYGDIDSLVKKTGSMKGTVGNLFDLAAEASEKRGGDNDPIKKKALEDYAKQRKGKKYIPPAKSNPVDIELRVK